MPNESSNSPDPAAVFSSPEEVLLREDLTFRQKADILRRWEYDAREGSVALEEGMPGAESDTLHQILAALGKLTGGRDVEHVGPSKQHGIPDRTQTRT